MKPINFPQSNKTLTKPADMTDEQCESLHVYTDGSECISCWQLSWKERFAALVGGRIWVFVHSGRTQPPIALMAQREIFSEDKH